MMKIAFRVDSSSQIGTGHFMRCLTLANALKPFSAKIVFICLHLPEYLRKMLDEKGYDFIRLNIPPDKNATKDTIHTSWLGVSQEQDALESKRELSEDMWDWLVVDHYALDFRWESVLRKCVGKILVIDDLADRKHDCDVLLDQNLYVDMETRYSDKVSANCKLFLGPRYTLLRDEFCEMRKYARPRSGPVKNVLLFFGGVDSNNDTGSALEALINNGGQHLNVDVVIGMQNPFSREIQLICEKYSFSCHKQTERIAELMCKADLAIGAGGISTYERLYLRLPAILKPLSLNQTEPLEYMSKIGLFDIFSTQQELENKLKRAFEHNSTSPPDCVEDGKKKLAAHLVAELPLLRKPLPLDIRRTFKWLQNEQLRKDFLMSESPLLSDHFIYWRKLVGSNDQEPYSIVYSEKHVGNCGLKNIDHEKRNCELWIYLGDISFRRRGIAKSSVLKLLSIAKNDLACTSVSLHVARANKEAICLYEKSGFVLADMILSGRWLGRDSEILFMQHLL
jgi:UDP-2,4-diacetamido-2,4,6-trideoxy-beta-L-altropyranose hydrolase